MNREEAERLAETLLLAAKAPGANLQAFIAKFLLQAYRKGAEEMRERAAHFAESTAHAPLCVVNAKCRELARFIRALPLTDDQPNNGQGPMEEADEPRRQD